MYSNSEILGLLYHYYLKDYTIMSISTSGSEVSSHEVLEVCAFRVRDGIIIEKFHRYINNSFTISKDSIAKNGVTPNLIKAYGNTPQDAYSDLINFLQNDTIIFDDLSFISPFISKEINISNNSIDLLHISKFLLAKKVTSFDLKTIAKYCHFKSFDQRRGAFNTCLAIHKIYEYLKNYFTSTYNS